VDSQVAYAGLIGLVICERIAELVVARRNSRRAFAAGGVEYGRGHYPPMVVLHTGLLAGCLVEPWLASRPFVPWLGWPALGVVLACQGVRWWCVATLGWRWNTRIIVVPGMPLVTTGPYRWMKHPNYAAVVAEGVALPLVHTAWVTAVTFTALNAVLIRHRIAVETAALAREVDAPPRLDARRPLFDSTA
jgi:methyltransferase